MVFNTFIKSCTIPDINNKIVLSNNKLYKFLGKKHIEEIINNIIGLPENYYIYGKTVSNNKFDADCDIPDDENKIIISSGKKVKFMSAKHRNEIIDGNMKMVEGYVFKTTIVKIIFYFFNNIIFFFFLYKSFNKFTMLCNSINYF